MFNYIVNKLNNITITNDTSIDNKDHDIKNNIKLGQKNVYMVDKLLQYDRLKNSYLVLFSDGTKEWVERHNISDYCITEYKQNLLINNFNNLNDLYKSTTKAYIYARISNKKHDGISIDVQTKTLMEYCKQNNICIKQIYVDNGISANNMNNLHSFYRLCNDLDNDKTDISTNIMILFYDVSRFSRNSTQAMKYLDMFEDKNINLYFHMENILYNKSSSFLIRHNLRVLLSQSQLLSESVSDKVKNSISYKRNILHHHIGGIPFGYKRHKGFLEINSSEMTIIKRVCSLHNRYSKLKIFKDPKKNILSLMKGTLIRKHPFTKKHIDLCLNRNKDIQSKKYSKYMLSK